jgi:hypothetical protein
MFVCLVLSFGLISSKTSERPPVYPEIPISGLRVAIVKIDGRI